MPPPPPLQQPRQPSPAIAAPVPGAAAPRPARRAVADPSDRECVVCMDRHIEIMLLPCTCFKLCMVCSESIKARKDNCPWCRAEVETHMRVIR